MKGREGSLVKKLSNKGTLHHEGIQVMCLEGYHCHL